MAQSDFIEQLLGEKKPLSVSELTSQIKALLEKQFSHLWVEGEISNFHRHSSGHWYFTLKDEGAMIRCASFRMQNRLIRFSPEDGLTVRIRGRISLYDVRGEYQIIVDSMEPSGIGALQLAFEQLKAKLEAEGLFDENHKRPLPRLPRCIGVVTSPTGAAVRDIINIIKRRNEGIRILIAPAKVQGEGAAEEIRRAIELLNSREDVDVIIVGRGGGSMEDLWPFNEEIVARTIYNSRLPVISAVGHETDFTIADFVADLRAPTPSAAAEIVAAARDEIYNLISSLRNSMVSRVKYRLMEINRSISAMEIGRVFNSVLSLMHTTSQRFDEILFAMEIALRKTQTKRRAHFESSIRRLHSADIRRTVVERRGHYSLLSSKILGSIRSLLDRKREVLSIAAGKLESLSPLAVLSRGYGIVFDLKGNVVKRAESVRPGDQVHIRVAEGEMDCKRI